MAVGVGGRDCFHGHHVQRAVVLNYHIVLGVSSRAFFIAEAEPKQADRGGATPGPGGRYPSELCGRTVL